MTIKTFIDYIVSDDPNKYPSDGLHTDGYWYEKVVEGAKVASGTINSAGGSYTLDIEHGLGVKPNRVMIIANPYVSGQFATGFYSENDNVNLIFCTNNNSAYTNAYPYASSNEAKMNIDESKISLSKIYPSPNSYGSELLYIGSIRWLAISE